MGCGVGDPPNAKTLKKKIEGLIQKMKVVMGS
jgi:hypothetical protein